MIRLDDIYAAYAGSREALQGISLQIEHGQMCFLTGHSGAGKSTLLRTILRLLKPFRGTVEVDGINLNELTLKDLPNFRRRIGIVFQNPQLLPDRSVLENIAIPLLVTEERKKNIQTRVLTALEQVGLPNFAERMPVTLSSGEQQRVSIARALINNPRLVLADEPTGNLDPGLSREIFGLFSAFNSHGTTILIATHDISLLANYPHRQIKLNQGRLVTEC